MPQTANPRAGVAAGSGETYAEVAHEAIFRRWDKLREWIAAEARIPGLAQWARNGAPHMAGNAGGREKRHAADGRGADAGAKLARQAQ